MNPLLAKLIQAGRAPHYRRFVEACGDVEASQEASLSRLAARLGPTRYGERHGVSKLRSLAELQARLPLITYDDLCDDIEATLQGEPNVLVPGEIQFFAMTAGTTGARKVLPITDAYRREFQATMNLYLYGLQRDHPEGFRGRALFFAGSADVDVAPCGIKMGAMSGYNFQSIPPLVRRAYASPYAAFALNDAVSRSYAVALSALRHEVSFVVAITTQPLAHLGQVMRTHADRLLKDLAEGTFNPPGPVTGVERQSLQAHWRADPRRARELERRASAHGGLTPKAAWPKLGLMSCWFHAGAGAFGHELPALYGDLPKRTAVYSATEGWFNVPMADGTDSGVLALGPNVYEFIPLDDRGQRTGDPVLAHQLTKGRRYVLVVSSGAGLWRYVTGDVVEITGFFQQAPLLQFIQKEGQTLSLGHDMTTETHVRTAVEALRRAGVPLARYCFGPGEGHPPRYRLVVAEAPGLKASTLAQRFDEALRQANFGYDADRAEEALAPVDVSLVPAEQFERFDAAQASAGAGAQSKPIEFTTSVRLLGAAQHAA